MTFTTHLFSYDCSCTRLLQAAGIRPSRLGAKAAWTSHQFIAERQTNTLLSQLQATLQVGIQPASTSRRRERGRAGLVRTCRTLCGSWAGSRARGSGGLPGCCSRSRPGSSYGILWCTRRCLKHNANAAGVHLQLLRGQRRDS